MPCDRDKLRADVDVDAGEYLKFVVTFAPGKRANYSVKDTTKKTTILVPPQLEAEWPAPGQSVDRGDHRIVFGADFAFASRYTYKAVVCHPSGATKAVVKSCRWAHPGRKPRSNFRAVVL